MRKYEVYLSSIYTHKIIILKFLLFNHFMIKSILNIYIERLR